MKKRRGTMRKGFRDAHPVIAGYADWMARAMTEPEFSLWLRMKTGCMGYSLRPQKPISGWRRFYIADFYCKKGRFVVEVDDPSHAVGWKARADLIRAQRMYSLHGITTIRITNEDVMVDPDCAAMSVLAMMRHLFEGAMLPLSMCPILVQGKQTVPA